MASGGQRSLREFRSFVVLKDPGSLRGGRALAADAGDAPDSVPTREWRLVGAAVEHAAATLAEQQRTHPTGQGTASTVDFGALFASVENDDEDATGLADVLDTLNSNWQGGYFQASDVARLINEPMAGEDAQAAALRSCAPQPRRLQQQGNRRVATTKNG